MNPSIELTNVHYWIMNVTVNLVHNYTHTHWTPDLLQRMVFSICLQFVYWFGCVVYPRAYLLLPITEQTKNTTKQTQRSSHRKLLCKSACALNARIRFAVRGTNIRSNVLIRWWKIVIGQAHEQAIDAYTQQSSAYRLHRAPFIHPHFAFCVFWICVQV